MNIIRIICPLKWISIHIILLKNKNETNSTALYKDSWQGRNIETHWPSCGKSGMVTLKSWNSYHQYSMQTAYIKFGLKISTGLWDNAHLAAFKKIILSETARPWAFKFDVYIASSRIPLPKKLPHLRDHKIM